MTKIGYDLDGVFLSDMYVVGDIKTFLEQRKTLPKALFVPNGDYDIVTGRPSSDMELTHKWVHRELVDNPPKTIHHQNPDLDKPAEYKAKVINENKYEVFIESDPNQVKQLTKKCPKTKIIHFATLIKNSIGV